MLLLNSLALPRGQLPSLPIQDKVREHIVKKLGPFPSEGPDAATRALAAHKANDPTTVSQVSVQQLLVD